MPRASGGLKASTRFRSFYKLPEKLCRHSDGNFLYYAVVCNIHYLGWAEGRVRLYEYEAKEILKARGINVPISLLIPGHEQSTPIDSLVPAVAKVQTQRGRRQKLGGVVAVDSVTSALEIVQKMLGREIGGEQVHHVLLEQRIPFEEEYFLGVTYDSLARRPVAVFSDRGGVDIEEAAAFQPDRVHRLVINPCKKFRNYHACDWLCGLGFSGKRLRSLTDIVNRVVSMFFEYDAFLLEINPLARMADDNFVALDCHIDIDEDALSRVPLKHVENLSNRAEGTRRLTEFERRAREIDELDYRGVAGRVVECPGNLGLLIGGGGASLTIFDAVRDCGGRPANYCEIGGNPTVRKVKELTKLLVSQPNVEKLAVIMNVVSNTRADLVARGVIMGIREAGKDPCETIVVFRLPGSGEDECRKLLNYYGIPFSGRELPIDDAAALAVARCNKPVGNAEVSHGHFD